MLALGRLRPCPCSPMRQAHGEQAVVQVLDPTIDKRRSLCSNHIV